MTANETETETETETENATVTVSGSGIAIDWTLTVGVFGQVHADEGDPPGDSTRVESLWDFVCVLSFNLSPSLLVVFITAVCSYSVSDVFCSSLALFISRLFLLNWWFG